MDRPLLRPLRLGVIGAGSWAIAAHLPVFARLDVVPGIVCRRDPAQLADVRRRFGFEAATTRWQDVIEAAPDIVLIASPAGLHYEQAAAALEAGAHVLCEKPFTVSSSDAWDLADRADRNDLVLMICYAYNELPIVERARAALATGLLGTFEYVSITMATTVRDLLQTGAAYGQSSMDSPPRFETWAQPELSGGGYGQGQLTHAIGLLTSLVDIRARSVSALMRDGVRKAIELHDALAVEFENGAIGSITGAASHVPGQGGRHQVSIRLVGDRGQLELDLERARLWTFTAGADANEHPLTERDVLWRFDPVVERFLGLVRGTVTDNPSSGAVGARAVDILDAAYRSRQSRHVELVSAPPAVLASRGVRDRVAQR